MGSVATFDFVYSSINCVYIIICARVTAMWVNSRHILHPFVRAGGGGGGCKSKKEMCSGALLERCYFEELKIDCIIDQFKPGLKSKVNGAIFCFVI